MLNCGFQHEGAKVVGLVRVSSKQQGQSGLGLKAQEKSIRSFAEREGLEVIKIISEVESGASKHRPKLDQAIKLARKNNAILCVARLDRLSRKVSVISELMEAGKVPFVSCELGMRVQPFMIHVWSAFAATERQKISERTSAALQAKIAGGWKAGNPELSKLSKKGNEAMRSKADRFALEIKSVVDGLRANGCNSFNGMAFEMNRAGVKTARGGEWSAQTVKRLVKRLEALEAKNAGEK